MSFSAGTAYLRYNNSILAVMLVLRLTKQVIVSYMICFSIKIYDWLFSEESKMADLTHAYNYNNRF